MAATALLALLRIRVAVDPGELTLSLRTATGRTAVVYRLDEVVDAAAGLTGHRLDPLASEIVDGMLAARGSAR